MNTFNETSYSILNGNKSILNAGSSVRQALERVEGLKQVGVT